MVLAERNSELVRNGRRSRGPSPNGHGASSGGGGSTGGAGGGVGGVGGAGTPENSSDDDNSMKRNGKSKTRQSEYEEKIRVGRDYQAICPSLIPEPERKLESLNDRALLVWSPTKEIPDTKLDDYISVAKEKYGYNGEQALGMLFWHKHDLERAVLDLANFTPFPDEWTVEDKVLFEQAFQFHGKSFHRIRQMLPDKSIASLVKYYYSWKKTRHRQSVMDRQEKLKANKEGSENGSDNGSNEESDDDKDLSRASCSGLKDLLSSKINAALLSISKTFDNVENENIAYQNNEEHNFSTINQNKSRQDTPPISNDSTYGGRNSPFNNCGEHLNSSNNSGSGGGGGSCTNCGVACNVLHTVPVGKLCSSCHHHWRRTGTNRPTSGPNIGKRSNVDRHKRKPPRGMYINHDDIVNLASNNGNKIKFLADIERQITSYLTQIQLNKQAISAIKRKNSEAVEDIRPPESNTRINPRWSNEEIGLVIESIRKYGKDFQTIAEVIGTKTEAHVRTFYMNSRRRYNLDQEVKKYEAEKEAAIAAAAAAASVVSANEVSASLSNNDNIIKDDIKEKEVSSIGTKTNENTITTTTATTTSSSNIVEESDNTTSSENTNASKSVNDDNKLSNSNSTTNVISNNTTIIQDEIMEIDLDAEQSNSTGPTDALSTPEPPTKKLRIALNNQSSPVPSPV